MPCRFSDRWPASQTQASWASWLCVDRLPLVNWTKKPLYTAVSRKVVLRTGKTLRDNLESYHGQWWFLRLLLNLKVFQHGGRKQHKHMYSFFLVPCCWITLNLNQSKPSTNYDQNQALTSYNANRHCRIVRFLHFCGQIFSKQVHTSLFKAPTHVNKVAFWSFSFWWSYTTL